MRRGVLLGLKGTMSEAELHVLKARLRGGILNKVRRGEYRCVLPTGFVYDEADNVVLDPDAQIRETITYFFETFARVGSACQTVKVFRNEGIGFPSRLRNRDATIFRPLTASTAIRILNNPRYAGTRYGTGENTANVWEWGRSVDLRRKRPLKSLSSPRMRKGRNQTTPAFPVVARTAAWQNVVVPEQPEQLPDWERLLAAERHLQHLVPGAVLVGGTAAAIHAGHRVSMDGDHVLEDLRGRFDAALAALEAAAGWQTERVQRPVLILGQLDGVLTGIRQLRRTRPLETEEAAGLRVPTLAEMARIKAWLLATRRTVRDYLDTVVLFERLGDAGVVAALASFDALYHQPGGASPLTEVAERLAAAAPADLAAVDLTTYRGLRPPWNDWQHLRARGRYWAERIAALSLREP